MLPILRRSGVEDQSMGAHLIDGEFQSDKYPDTPRNKLLISLKDPDAQDLLWAYAQRHRTIDAEFSDDLEQALLNLGYTPPQRMALPPWPSDDPDVWHMRVSRAEHQILAKVLEYEPAHTLTPCPICRAALSAVRECKGCHFAGKHKHRTCSGCGASFTHPV